jgi:endonuclease/exonuclease/phosphatase family metal-dependent hydrolase
MTFRLLTYNIMHGGGDRIAAIAEVIKGCAPDLVLLQEASNPLNVRKDRGIVRHGRPSIGAGRIARVSQPREGRVL